MFEGRLNPYPGLRPFTEEESIFFKGRDRQIREIIKQLEERKYVMVTGASGDGKSSIIYAGVIPQIKAGFIHADFNNWRTAELKPEKSPFYNLCTAISDALNLDLKHVSKRLKFGFSAIIDLYKESGFYLDKNSEEWTSASTDERKKLKRKAANLFVLIDQFEEFFTNAENYYNNVPSKESQLVINLMLETARLAQEQQLPIYIVNTMRSDFIGQCAAHRGLPEFIGYSEFFVPRLKRKEIFDVIKVPAELSGTQITPRLVEVLINELHDGYDQLPVLQHALNQIWELSIRDEAAEMDLIHLAKIGGMHKKYLQKEDQLAFDSWYEKTLESRKEYADEIKREFENPSLENVLDAHANELYLTAHEHFFELYPKYKGQLSIEGCRQIIKTVFQSLTKIDGGRPVRHRMSLSEITQIINDPDINKEIVTGLIYTFRKQGNTFIAPFAFDEKVELSGDTILDITHESLIRNWHMLKYWTSEDHHNFVNYLDFEKQFNRWVENEKKSGFLLPIGPLTFFEGWHKKAKPNPAWLLKFDERKIDQKQKQTEAKQKLNNAQLFLRKSARRLVITRTFMKYGAGKIGAVLGLIALFISITYFYFDYQRKTNEHVLQMVEERGLELLSSRKIDAESKAGFIIDYERLHPGSYQEILAQMPDTTAFDVNVYMVNMLFGKFENDTFNLLLRPVFQNLQHLSQSIVEDGIKKGRLEDYKLDRYIKFTQMAISYKTNIKINLDTIYHKIADNLYSVLINRIENDSLGNMETFYNTLASYVFFNSDTARNHTLIQKLSPFTPHLNDSFFFKHFPEDEKLTININYFDNEAITHNAGYVSLSFLYASVGDIELTANCFDSITKFNQEYTDYSSYLFLLYNLKSNIESLDENLKRIAITKAKSELDILRELKSESFNQYGYYYNIKRRYIYLNYYYKLSEEKQLQLWRHYFAKSWDRKTPDEINFAKALDQKNFGLFHYYILKDTLAAYEHFRQAFNYYDKVSKEFLDKEINISINEKYLTKPKLLFLAPLKTEVKYDNTWSIYKYWDEPNGNSNRMAFLDFLMDNPNYTTYYNDKEVLEKFNLLLNTYVYASQPNTYMEFDTIEYTHYPYLNFSQELHSKYHFEYDTNAYIMVEIQKAFLHKDTSKVSKLFKQLNLTKVSNGDYFKEKEIVVYARKELLLKTGEAMAINGDINNALKLLYSVDNLVHRRNTLLSICYNLQEQGPVEHTFIYLDSLYSDIEINNKFGQALMRILGKMGSNDLIELAHNTLKNTDDRIKIGSYHNLVKGILESNMYYLAYTQIPDYISLQSELALYRNFLQRESFLLNLNSRGWKAYINSVLRTSWRTNDLEDEIYYY